LDVEVLKMDREEQRREGAILAGLRLLQSYREGRITLGSSHAEAIEDISGSGGEVDDLTVTEIDGLCEAINLGEIAIKTVVRS
jgi:hypothetical protein